ncbi:type II toxin-antitoxin system RelE/ParE family toxin [Kovacikia minuta CCNUW1]|uniref:type II toxin-antitoxin system RelE/ParE family toxin n=1 Tax=Kovacikia minuta TaxID=2931930 RepID=UPI001CCA3AB8|nr:type II toxin-antitoxin system RelE/ParE family toxin [Kovacikia minuta]UBF26267.1 type II toxin-antitoxin system RelE/ParE family toxin [Kovacikia minuta CCNUW1]
MEEVQIEVRIYVTASGKQPFLEWLDSLRDCKAAAKIKARLRRVELGNLGDWKQLEESSVCEFRIGGRAGYRIYFGRDEEVVVLLLGGDKDTQTRDIIKAEQYWADYEQRKSSGE